MNRSLHYFVFFVGLAAVCWVGAGYIGSNPLALAITGSSVRSISWARWSCTASTRPRAAWNGP